MKPLEALKVLDEVAGTFKGSRQDHIKISTATKVLQDFIAKHEPAQAKPADLEEKNDE